MNTFDEMDAAVQDAERTLRVADELATRIARFLVGRLRKVNSQWILADLKRELKDFNMQTQKWKNEA